MMYITQERKHVIQNAIVGKMDVGDIVGTVLEMVDVGVESPSILPGVTQGKWRWAWHGPADDSSERVEVTSSNGVRIYTRFCGKASSCGYSREEAIANGKVMTASKEITEEAVKLIQDVDKNCSGSSRTIALRKACRKGGAKI